MTRGAGRLAWLLAVVVATAACRPAPPGAGEVRIALAVEPPDLDPLLGDAGAIAIALGDVYEPLARPAEDGGPLADELVLASRWERTDGDRTWRFTLRPEARWHDGARVTSADVRATFTRLAGLATPLAAEFDDVTALETPDDATVVLRFNAFRVGRAGSLARVPILPAHVDPAALARAPVGSGPYRVALWRPGEAIVLERAPGARSVPPVARARYVRVGERAQALAQLRAGALDLVPSVPAAEVASAGPAARAIAWDARSASVVVWNTARLREASTRRALTETLDRAGLVRELLGGRGRVLATPWPEGDPAHDPALAPWPFDPGAAARALGAPLAVEVLVPDGSATLRRALAIWAEDARPAGITLTVRAVPFATLLERVAAGDFDGAALALTVEREQDLWHLVHSSQRGQGNLSGIADAALDRLADDVRSTPDPGARATLEHALGARLHELEPFTIVFGDVRVGVAGPRLAAVRLGPLGAPVRAMRLAR